MEAEDKQLKKHCKGIKEFVTEGEFGEYNEEEFEKLLESTPHINKVHGGDAILNTLFSAASEKMTDEGDKKVLEKLLKMVKFYEHEVKEPISKHQKVLFFPNEDNVAILWDYIKMAKKNLRICIFTFTNNDLSKAVMDWKKRGVQVQIITDDECVKQKGSDIEYLASKGCEIRTDNSVVNILSHFKSF